MSTFPRTGPAVQPASRSKGSLAQGLLQVGIFRSAGAVPEALGAPRSPRSVSSYPRGPAGRLAPWGGLAAGLRRWMNPPGSLASGEAGGREWGGHVVCRSRGGASRAALPGVEARRPAALRLRCPSSGAQWGQIVPGAFPALGGLSILLCAGVGGEPAECCDLRFGAGWGRAPLMIPRWPWSWEALFALGGERVGGWILGRPREASGPHLAWGAGSPPLPLGDRPGCPRGLASAPGSSGLQRRPRGTGPGVCPEASSGKKPPERLCFQAFLVKGSSGHPHSRILQEERRICCVVSAAHLRLGRPCLGSPKSSNLVDSL